MHRTAEEAREETLRMFNVYKTFQEDFLALPVILVRKLKKKSLLELKKLILWKL